MPLRTSFATEADAAVADLVVTVAAGGVIITVDVIVSSDGDGARSVVAALEDAFASASALSDFLGASVESVVSAPEAMEGGCLPLGQDCDGKVVRCCLSQVDR